MHSKEGFQERNGRYDMIVPFVSTKHHPTRSHSSDLASSLRRRHHLKQIRVHFEVFLVWRYSFTWLGYSFTLAQYEICNPPLVLTTLITVLFPTTFLDSTLLPPLRKLPELTAYSMPSLSRREGQIGAPRSHPNGDDAFTSCVSAAIRIVMWLSPMASHEIPHLPRDQLFW